MNDELMLLLSFIPDLKPRGDEFVALCPFHAETRPSFHVNLEKRLFYCFGCGVGGTFDTLFRMLKIKPERQSDTKTTQNIHAVLASAQRFFREQLRLNHNVREILKRQNRELFVDRFGLGFAPNDHNILRDFLRREGFTDDLLIKSGLFSESLYPLIRNRVTIPIKDLSGRIVAFAGRALDDSQNPKYINTRSSPLFNKSATLYLAEYATALFEKVKKIYVVEGYFDAMALNYAQLPSVAIMGTRLTALQTLLLKGIVAKVKSKTRIEPKVIVLLDSDEAGLHAAVEITVHLLAFGVTFEVGLLPEGCDPEELAIQNRMSEIKYLQPIQAIASLIANLRIEPKRVARLLLQLPLEYRQQVFKILRILSSKVGEAYLKLVNFFIRQAKANEFRKVVPKLSLDEMIVASVLKQKINVSQLPEGYIETLPKDLALILRSIAEGKPFPPSVEALAARLSFQQVFIDQDNLLQAALSKVLKREALNALLQAKSADASELPNLRRKFVEAQQALDSLRATSIDELF